MSERDGSIFSHLRQVPLDDSPAGAVDLELLLDRLRYSAFDGFRIKGVPAFFRPSQIRDFGLTPDHLPALIRCGAVERVCRGLYHLVNEGRGKRHLLAMACARAPGSIVCLHSALRVHGIESQTAETVWLAVPRRRGTPRLRHTAVRILRFNAIASSFRVRDTDIDGVPAYITSPERTVADCFRLTRQAGAEAGPVAFRDALGKGLVDIEELARIEGVLHCRRLRGLLARYAQDPCG